MNEFIEIAFSKYSAGEYLGIQFLAIVGFTLMSLWNYAERTDKTKPLSVTYWWSKNWLLFVSLIVTMYLGLRFQLDLIGYVYELVNIEASTVADKWFGFPVAGFLYRVIVHRANKLIQKLKKK